jgi:hypothetical protein
VNPQGFAALVVHDCSIAVLADKNAVAFYKRCGFEQSTCTAMWMPNPSSGEDTE